MTDRLSPESVYLPISALRAAVLRFRTNCYVLGLVSPYREPDNADAWPTISYLKNG